IRELLDDAAEIWLNTFWLNTLAMAAFGSIPLVKETPARKENADGEETAGGAGIRVCHGTAGYAGLRGHCADPAEAHLRVFEGQHGTKLGVHGAVRDNVGADAVFLFADSGDVVGPLR